MTQFPAGQAYSTANLHTAHTTCVCVRARTMAVERVSGSGNEDESLLAATVSSQRVYEYGLCMKWLAFARGGRPFGKNAGSH